VAKVCIFLSLGAPFVRSRFKLLIVFFQFFSPFFICATEVIAIENIRESVSK
jgi:hypothetical protein